MFCYKLHTFLIRPPLRIGAFCEELVIGGTRQSEYDSIGIILSHFLLALGVIDANLAKQVILS